jgi:hypothetical protein
MPRAKRIKPQTQLPTVSQLPHEMVQEIFKIAGGAPLNKGDETARKDVKQAQTERAIAAYDAHKADVLTAWNNMCKRSKIDPSEMPPASALGIYAMIQRARAVCNNSLSVAQCIDLLFYYVYGRRGDGRVADDEIANQINERNWQAQVIVYLAEDAWRHAANYHNVHVQMRRYAEGYKFDGTMMPIMHIGSFPQSWMHQHRLYFTQQAFDKCVQSLRSLPPAKFPHYRFCYTYIKPSHGANIAESVEQYTTRIQHARMRDGIRATYAEAVEDAVAYMTALGHIIPLISLEVHLYRIHSLHSGVYTQDDVDFGCSVLLSKLKL